LSGEGSRKSSQMKLRKKIDRAHWERISPTWEGKKVPRKRRQKRGRVKSWGEGTETGGDDQNACRKAPFLAREKNQAKNWGGSSRGKKGKRSRRKKL